MKLTIALLLTFVCFSAALPARGQSPIKILGPAKWTKEWVENTPMSSDRSDDWETSAETESVSFESRSTSNLINWAVFTSKREWAATYGNASWWSWSSWTRPRVFTCLSEPQTWIEDECLSVAANWYKIWAKKNYDECIERHEHGTWDPDHDKNEHCRSIQTKQIRIFYADCVISKSGSMNDTTGKIDWPTFKAATIGATNMTVAQKQDAITFFDGCIASEIELPYSMYHYKTETIPAKLREYALLSDRVFRIGDLNPSLSMIAVDCSKAALLQKGCADETTEETLIQVIDVLTTIDRKHQ
jgi:hypothetical protein